jgi:predicted Zn-dependent peptidase
LYSLLAGPEGGRLVSALVRARQLATGTGVNSTFPGPLSPSLFVVMVVRAARETDELGNAVDEVIEKLRAEPAPEDELAGAKAWYQAQTLNSLEAPAAMAAELARAHAERGSWRQLIEDFDAIGAVTAAQVQQAAQRHLSKERRLVVALGPGGGGK